MREALFQSVDKPFTYLRICSYRESSPESLEAMRANGWRRPSSPLDKDGTLILDLSPGEEKLLDGLSGNWGHNLRRGRKRCRGIRPWDDPRVDELVHVYRDMESFKDLSEQYDERALESLISHLGGKVILYRADGPDGSPVALRAAALQGGRAWDLLAANSRESRRSYASYALLWELLNECRRRGARTYDMGGVDPQGNKGVYDFKKGTGAKPMTYLGEWEHARPSIFRHAANLAIRLRPPGAT